MTSSCSSSAPHVEARKKMACFVLHCCLLVQGSQVWSRLAGLKPPSAVLAVMGDDAPTRGTATEYPRSCLGMLRPGLMLTQNRPLPTTTWSMMLLLWVVWPGTATLVYDGKHLRRAVQPSKQVSVCDKQSHITSKTSHSRIHLHAPLDNDYQGH